MIKINGFKSSNLIPLLAKHISKIYRTLRIFLDEIVSISHQTRHKVNKRSDSLNNKLWQKCFSCFTLLRLNGQTFPGYMPNDQNFCPFYGLRLPVTSLQISSSYLPFSLREERMKDIDVTANTKTFAQEKLHSCLKCMAR